jgi:polyisoprenoid-binding protein YceI
MIRFVENNCHLTGVYMRLLVAALGLAVAFTTQANWQLDPANSQLRFVSVKNSVVAEVHSLKQLSGQWANDGKVSISIPVASVDTLIPIRNERMLEHVFQAAKFPNITATTRIEPKLLADLMVGGSMQHNTELALTLLDQTQTLPVQLTLTKLADGKIQASTLAPVMVNSASFKLDAGVKTLQELAKLNDISLLVPVTFSVEFNR